jgi:hypothetical protein
MRGGRPGSHHRDRSRDQAGQIWVTLTGGGECPRFRQYRPQLEIEDEQASTVTADEELSRRGNLTGQETARRETGARVQRATTEGTKRQLGPDDCGRSRHALLNRGHHADPPFMLAADVTRDCRNLKPRFFTNETVHTRSVVVT